MFGWVIDALEVPVDDLDVEETGNSGYKGGSQTPE